MNKILLSLVLLLPITALAAGPFDGIYRLSVPGIPEIGYASIHEDANNNMIAILLDAESEDTWQALNGARTNNNVTLKSIAGTIDLEVSAEFNDNQESTATVISCTGDDCDIPNGAILKMDKLF